MGNASVRTVNEMAYNNMSTIFQNQNVSLTFICLTKHAQEIWWWEKVIIYIRMIPWDKRDKTHSTKQAWQYWTLYVEENLVDISLFFGQLSFKICNDLHN